MKFRFWPRLAFDGEKFRFWRKSFRLTNKSIVRLTTWKKFFKIFQHREYGKLFFEHSVRHLKFISEEKKKDINYFQNILTFEIHRLE